MSRLPLDQKGYVLTGLIGGSLQGLIAALAVMSPAERNARRYREMYSLLNQYTAERLDSLRGKATSGDRGAVREFAAQITADLAAEGREWLILQEVLSEMVPKRLVDQKV